MLPFCGYNMADYFGHWLKVGQKLRFDRAPRIFQVNWFRKGSDGRFLWPGFGDNSRVVDWIIRRIEGEVPAVESPIGRLPRTEDLNLDGLDVSQADLDELFAVDAESWQREADLTEEFYATFEGRVPAAAPGRARGAALPAEGCSELSFAGMPRAAVSRTGASATPELGVRPLDRLGDRPQPVAELVEASYPALPRPQTSSWCRARSR